MKKYDIEVRTNEKDLWDSDAIGDYIEADTAEEAKDYARQHLLDSVDSQDLIDEIEQWAIRAREVIWDSEYEVEEYGEWQ